MIGCSCGQTLCQGKTEQICATKGYAAYLWSTGATTDCITISIGGTYSVVVTKSNGCTSSCSTEINVSPNPSCTISGVDSICAGGNTTFCAPSGNASYLWSNGALASCVTLYTGGTVSVTVTNASGCSSTCSKTVKENALPACNITGNLVICEGDTTTLAADAGSTSYFWSTGATTRSISVTAIGNYSVTVNNSSDCSVTCFVCVTLGACRKSQGGIQVGAYPNPFASQATVEFMKVDKTDHATVEIFTLAGSKITTIFDGVAEEGVVYKPTFDALNLADGIYVYRIVSGKDVIIGRLSLIR